MSEVTDQAPGPPRGRHVALDDEHAARRPCHVPRTCWPATAMITREAEAKAAARVHALPALLAIKESPCCQRLCHVTAKAPGARSSLPSNPPSRARPGRLACTSTLTMMRSAGARCAGTAGWRPTPLDNDGEKGGSLSRRRWRRRACWNRRQIEAVVAQPDGGQSPAPRVRLAAPVAAAAASSSPRASVLLVEAVTGEATAVSCVLIEQFPDLHPSNILLLSSSAW